jgi:hypothetical protein
MKTPTVSLQQTQRPPAGKNGNDRTVNGFHFRKNKGLAAERNGGTSLTNGFTHSSEFAVVISNDSGGKISVIGINIDENREFAGTHVRPGTIYIAKQISGAKAGIVLNPVSTHNRLSQVGHYNDGRDEGPRAQIAKILVESSGAIAEAATSMKVEFARPVGTPKSFSPQDRFIAQIQNEKTKFAIGNNDLTRIKKRDKKVENYNASIPLKRLGNDLDRKRVPAGEEVPDENPDRNRVSDRHSYADAVSLLSSLASDGSLTAEEKSSKARAQIRIMKALTTTRQVNDFRKIPRAQFPYLDEWIPHEAVKHKPRLRSGKRTTGRSTGRKDIQKGNGKVGTEDTQSHNVTLAKAKFHSILRREDGKLSEAGYAEDLENKRLKEIDESTEPIDIKLASVAETLIAMHLGRPYEYDIRISEHRNLIDTALESMEAIPYKTRKKTKKIEQKDGTIIRSEIRVRKSRGLFAIAREVEDFISRHHNPEITDLAASGIRSGVDLATFEKLLDMGASTDELKVVIENNSPYLNKKVLDKLFDGGASLEFLKLYLTTAKGLGEPWFSLERFETDTLSITEKRLGTDFYREYAELTKLMKEVSYPRESFEADLNRLMKLPPTAIAIYRTAYKDFAKTEGPRRKEALERSSYPMRTNRDFKGNEFIDEIIEALGTGEIYSASLDLSSQGRLTQHLNIPGVLGLPPTGV